VSNRPVVRKTWAQIEEVRSCAGKADGRGPLRKVAMCAVISNPLAGCGYVDDLSTLIDASAQFGEELGQQAVALLDGAVASYGKGAIAGTAGEQEHANAVLTSVFGNAFRDAVGGGKAWITSATKVGAPGSSIDIPLAFKDDLWVRSHYDAFEVHVPDAPLPDEILIIAAVTNRGRINARLGGRTLEQALADAR